MTWAQRLRHVFAIDIEKCVSCFGELKRALSRAGQGGYEIRTLIATAAAARGAKAEAHFFEPIPIFATSCFCVSFNL